MFPLPVFTLLLLCLSQTRCHMVLTTPKPWYQATTSPLSKDGRNFPCQLPSGTALDGPVAESVAAGSMLNMKISNTICHGGGSCQHSLSYDGGKNFMVIESLIGGCPIKGGAVVTDGGQGDCRYDFSVPIPANAPSGQAVFAWSWVNKVGGREFYMGCAIIEITGGGQGFSSPKMFTGNIYGDSDCVTKEGDDFVYSNPGEVVTYGGKWASGTPGPTLYSSTCSVNQDEMITVDGSGKVTQGGSGSPLDKKVGQASGAGAGEASASASGSAVPAFASGSASEIDDSASATPSRRPDNGNGRGGGGRQKEGETGSEEEEEGSSTSEEVALQTNTAGKACRPRKKNSATAWIYKDAKKRK